MSIVLRPARDTDCRFLWELANDPIVRAASFSSEPIPWEDHADWYERKIKDTGTLLYVAIDGDLPIGQVRFDLAGDEATISISIGGEHRGGGIGSRLIREGVQAALSERPDIRRVHAYIKPENTASVRAFEKAAFWRREATSVKEQPAEHYVYEVLPEER